MIVRKLRLKKCWSQEQLAELADVSVRTIQRAERGHALSLETARSLASVFEVDISTFSKGVNNMNLKDDNKATTENNQQHIISNEENATQSLKSDEEQAIVYVKGIKEFYSHLFMYLIFALVLFVFKSNTHKDLMLPFLGWGIGVIAHGLIAFEVVGLKFHQWEKKQIEKKLGRKL